jgi:hypothetical protein
MGSNETSGFTAAAAEEVLSLDHINLGPDFVAVAGIFSDHAFLDYLYQQSTVDYVEQNQVFKSTAVVPRKEEKVKEQEYVSNIKSARSANWGLARINQHQRGNLDRYEYDAMGGYCIIYMIYTHI